MADELPSFSKEDLDVITKKLEEYKINNTCTSCGGQMGIVTGFFAPTIGNSVAAATRIFGERHIFPLIALSCNRCGHMAFYAAEALGLMELFQRKGSK